MTLCCAICFYIRTGKSNKAITIIEGYAVCDDHIGYVAQGQRFAAITRLAKEQE